MRLKLTISRKLFLSHFLAVFLVSGSIGTYFYYSAYQNLMDNLKSRLLNSAALIAQSLDARDLGQIKTPQDTSLPIYQRTLKYLRKLKHTNQDIAFLYLMRRQGDKVYFVIDSDETDGQASPGQIYEPVPNGLMAGFSVPSVNDEIYHDQWGDFLSGYAPIPHGEGHFLVGMDMRSAQVGEKMDQLQVNGLISLIGSFILTFVFSRLLARRLVSGIRVLMDRCADIASGRLGERVSYTGGDELHNLFNAFNSMSQKLAESEQHELSARRSLEKARDELELRVKDRTRELTELNARLRDEVAERRRAQEALNKAARTDPLTDLLNRRSLTDHLQFLIAHNQRSQEPFCLIMADLDHFKSINDTHGHQAGDQVLVRVATLLREATRKQDMVARWGGEEFLLLLPDTQLEGGLVLADKIRREMEVCDLCFSGLSLNLTISLGVAQYEAGQTGDQCIQAADKALYLAKERGRNQVAEIKV